MEASPPSELLRRRNLYVGGSEPASGCRFRITAGDAGDKVTFTWTAL
ncbi:hypothetical protein OHB56_37790 [Streptomyces sp. NBC_01635]|uniref:Uncharacterized protein n=1 Tax=Streptomyces hirsutus TaxID=35620 RepID=A0ABZ1GZR3_9ACTN|nr:hypothetical protein [Streptomyces hirsutus]WSD10504.1 hypothetical protein OIE73_35515 [Streptomyces hirsutus]WTD79076.1 hypothetical protein OHB56_37790 [Streptomyces sp. NBC_01635]